jgi:ABC-2 type transport system permease protein
MSVTELNPPLMSAPGATRLTTELVLIGRSLRHTLRNVDALMMSVALPVILMLLFTYVFGGAIDPSGGYVQYVVPGIILLCAGFGSATTAVDVATDMTNGVIDRLRTMPIASSAVLTGHVVASLARNLVATAIVIGVALLLGFRPTAGPGEWLAAVGLIALFILAITWLFAAIGLVARSVEAANGYGFILLFLPYLSSAFVPVDTMPAWMRWVADNQPITPVIETLRGLLTGGPIGSSGWLALGWSLLILLGSYLWGVTTFRRNAAKR